jgi:hypothetical protein
MNWLAGLNLHFGLLANKLIRLGVVVLVSTKVLMQGHIGGLVSS